MGYRAWGDGYNVALGKAVARAGLSRREVARRLSMNEDTVGSYFKDGPAGRCPPADVLAAILAAVGGSADEVLGLSGQVADDLRRCREQLELGRAALRGDALDAAARLDETRAPAGRPRRPR